MVDFWSNCGFHQLKRDPGGRLVLTDDFLRSYLMRPELHPIEGSCENERALHRELLADPRAKVEEARLAALADEDLRENYRIMLRFRERLTSAPSLEACYAAIFQEADAAVPLLFINHLVQVILRHILERHSDPLQIRAAEMLFRDQKISINNGTVLAADAETVDAHARNGGLGNLGRFLVQAQAPLRGAKLTVLNDDNAEVYWGQSEVHDTVLALNPSHPGCTALCRVLEAWVEHFHQVRVKIIPVPKIESEEWYWHVGLDAEASGILNDVYLGKEVPDDRQQRLLCLLRLDFINAQDMCEEIAGRPVFLGMAMSGNSLLRMKPQNLLMNLPLARRT
ncbi:MAG TPA: DUF6352 family protein [Burkholderiales bacterium]|nr:DUF6352 family protein [Burkholderiales bacterium]